MTVELEAYYFPEKRDQLYQEFLKEEDHFVKKLEARKKGHH
jgi:hypothetical protein